MESMESRESVGSAVSFPDEYGNNDIPPKAIIPIEVQFEDGPNSDGVEFTGKRKTCLDMKPPLKKIKQMLPMCRKQPKKTREWKRRCKVSSEISRNFPWDVIISHLVKHPQSLVLLQMVDKNLNSVLKVDHPLWVRLFRRHLQKTAFVNSAVEDPCYPGLKLYKFGLHGIPIHIGFVRGDPCFDLVSVGRASSVNSGLNTSNGRSVNNSTDTPIPEINGQFDKTFTAYVRKAMALLYSPRCGLCGCSKNHQIYWSLGMRICRLCVAQNTMTSWKLFDKYGIHYYDIARQISGKVFYFTSTPVVSEDCIAYHEARYREMSHKMSMFVFWQPHLEKILDLPTLYQEQKVRKAAAQMLCAVMKRTFVMSARIRCRKSYSADPLLCCLFRNEKIRIVAPYKRKAFITAGGPYWAFPERSQSQSRHFKRHGEHAEQVHRHLLVWEDRKIVE